MQLFDREAGRDRCRGLHRFGLALEGQQGVLRIGPAHCRQCGAGGADQPDMIGAAISGDDEVA